MQINKKQDQIISNYSLFLSFLKKIVITYLLELLYSK